MEIKVLGSCCGNCDNLVAIVKEVVAEKGLGATVRKVTDYKEIVGYGIMRTPGLVVDGKVLAYGRVPSKEEVSGWLTTA